MICIIEHCDMKVECINKNHTSSTKLAKMFTNCKYKKDINLFFLYGITFITQSLIYQQFLSKTSIPCHIKFTACFDLIFIKLDIFYRCLYVNA